MKAHYYIHHTGQPIAAADTIEQARAIVRQSRAGKYQVVEVCDDPQAFPSNKTRTWGYMIRQVDGPVIVEAPFSMTPDLVP